MNNLSSYRELKVDAKIRASDKDLPVPRVDKIQNGFSFSTLFEEKHDFTDNLGSFLTPRD